AAPKRAPAGGSREKSQERHGQQEREQDGQPVHAGPDLDSVSAAHGPRPEDDALGVGRDLGEVGYEHRLTAAAALLGDRHAGPHALVELAPEGAHHALTGLVEAGGAPPAATL